jgi:hypothetical protein
LKGLREEIGWVKQLESLRRLGREGNQQEMR